MKAHFGNTNLLIMKKITATLLMIIFFTLIMNAQNDFKDLWLKVEQFEADGLPKSALQIVQEISIKSDKENNNPQIIKSLFYKSKFSLKLEEDAQLTVINNFKKQISISKFPTKNILQNILANLYWQYFKENLYKFYNRTKVEYKIDSADFRTWDINTLFKEIHTYFDTSLMQPEQLQHIKIEEFADILQINKESSIYRPTLYDFLANNALQFYKSSENSITKPSYKLVINNASFLKGAHTYSQLNITSKDSLSLQLNALRLYQNLIDFHLKENNKNALSEIDIQRLNFVYKHSNFNEKEPILLNTLQTSKKEITNHSASGLYAFEIANLFKKQANLNTSETKKNRFKNEKAIVICNEVINKYPNSFGAKKCRILKSQIEEKTLFIKAEAYIPIGKNSRVLITYKNLDTLFFSSYKINLKQQLTFNKLYKLEEKKAFLNKLEKSKTWQHQLRNEHDYLQHTTEVIVPKFDNGIYLILASETQDLKKNSMFGVSYIQATNLSLVENTFEGKYNYQIVHRNTGEPIKNANIHLKSTYKQKGVSIDKKLITDKNGFAYFKSKDYYRDVLISVTTKDDSAHFENHNLYNQSNQKKHHTEEITLVKSFIFTDRSIYRPGQTIYFKAIVIKKQGNKSEVFKNEYVEVILKDVNNQEVKKIDLKLNEFGSVASEFIIPNNGLTGEYSLTSKLQNTNSEELGFTFDKYFFSVEEYKRPKFETKFNPTEKNFKINDSITIKGFAKTFSGANITDAKVVYRVYRKAQYPNWYSWYRPNPISETQEITNGESSTDASGNFEIKFKAIPDENVLKENLPIFKYEITANVTDINGETRSASTIVKVGYHALIATIYTQDKIDKNKKETALKIDTKNLNDEFVTAKGSIKIYKLKSPKNPLRKRPWPTPEYQDISENTFRTLFPHDAYTDNESDENKWKKGELVFSINFDTSISKEIILKNTKNWISGKYMVVLNSKDKFGQEVKDEKRFTLFSSKEKKIPDNKLFFINTNKTFYEIGDEVELQIGSASKNMSVVVQIEKDHKIVDTQIIKLNNCTTTIKVSVHKEDIGGFAIKYHFVNYNYFESGNVLISVPEKQESIEIETNIFRDKLQPGQKETWSFTIKNDKNDALTAEVLASMYDASLDEFKAHNWKFNPVTSKTNYYSYNVSKANTSFKNTRFNIKNNQRKYFGLPSIANENYKWFGFRFARNRNFMMKRMSGISEKGKTDEIEMADGLEVEELEEIAFMKIEDNTKEKISLKKIQIRKNFKETAFFFPQLKTDKNGKVSFSFVMPEALTRWKLQLLAHTTDLKSSSKTLQTITQKELMVVPNVPRFLREKDTITLSAKITNLTNNQLSGIAKLLLTDAISGKEIDMEFQNTNTTKSFIVDKDGNTNVSWQISIPETVQAVQYKIVANSGAFSDGEQNVLPILTNKMLVTETLPIWVRSNQTKTFTFDKLKKNTSSTLKNHKLTLEMSSNPVWYAIQSLPYLMEYPHACSEQMFSKYYANTLASFVTNSNPKIQAVFDAWKTSDALLSNLEKNEELKSIIIQETPWVRDAASETEQKKRIAMLFDLSKMKNEQERTIHKLQDIQMDSGGFPWFKGGRYESKFITQHIVTGFSHLQKLGITDFNKTTKNIIEKALEYLDSEFLAVYKQLLKRASEIKESSKTKKKGEIAFNEFLSKNNLNYFTIQYLYMRSFYANISLDDKTQAAVDYYQNQTTKYWNEFNLYAKGQIALSLFRNEEKAVANKIIKSLKENSITSDELGMYWKENTAGFFYYQAPVETQALMIETFSEIENDKKTIDNLKIWLLKNKQTNNWKTTKATTEAIYAILLNGNDWFSITEMVDIQVGNQKINTAEMPAVKLEAGTGYFKTSWNGDQIKPDMAEVTINKKGTGVAWGGLYWQYFEDLNKITSAETPLKINKKLFLKVNSDAGKELKEIDKNTKLKVGDLITVRIELRSDRNMEFIHMKDMRASGVEPIHVLSKYKWQDNLGYYQSTKDATTNFFFDQLPKGIYVFEYDVSVNNTGDFSNGITTIQSMYAPEFSSHSEGVRIKVFNN